MSLRMKVTAGTTALVLPLLIGGGAAGASDASGQITYTDDSGQRITCDYYGSGGIVGNTNQGSAYTENSINQQTTPGCEAEMAITATYTDTDGKRRRHSASSVGGRTLWLHSFDVASDYVATHDIWWLSCQNPDPGDACSVRFTTK
jgi:hypothetical protein